jgi:hypothetical protein
MTTACSAAEGKTGGPICLQPATSRSIPLLWLQLLELLGRVPEGSTARFIKDGTLPG